MEILKVSEVGLNVAAKRAADVLQKGGIIVYPTDTLYGIGVDALHPTGLTNLRLLKAREAKKPVSILMPSLEEMARHAHVSDEARALAARLLPGALTIVLPAKDHVPSDLTHNGGVSFRIPDDMFARTLAALFPHPITATSANLAGLQTPATIPDIINHFGARIEHIDLFIDDGPRAGGVPSTVISFVTNPPHIIREGAISRAVLGL